MNVATHPIELNQSILEIYILCYVCYLQVFICMLDACWSLMWLCLSDWLSRFGWSFKLVSIGVLMKSCLSACLCVCMFNLREVRNVSSTKMRKKMKNGEGKWNFSTDRWQKVEKLRKKCFPCILSFDTNLTSWRKW